MHAGCVYVACVADRRVDSVRSRSSIHPVITTSNPTLRSLPGDSSAMSAHVAAPEAAPPPHQFVPQQQPPVGPPAEYSSSSEHSRGTGSDGAPRKLVILGLPYFTADETLHEFFSQYGAVEEAMVMRDHATGKSRGFGFVTFKTSNDAARIAGGEYVVDGRRCEAKYPLPRGEVATQRVTRIFVAKLPQSVTEDDLRDYFLQVC